MPNFQQVIAVGHLGADPEIRHSPTGTAIANLRLAVTEKWKDKATGEQKEQTEWIRVSVFGPSAEKYVGQYLSKGDVVMVKGKMQTRKWQDSAGQDRYTTEVIADRFGGVQGIGGGKRQATQQQPKDYAASHNAQAPNDSAVPFNDEIPF